MSREKITVPPELENMLLDYTIKAIVENPDDLVDHAADYFARLRDEKRGNKASKPKPKSGAQLSTGSQKDPEEPSIKDDDGSIDPEESPIGDDDGSKEHINKILGKRATSRRQTVMGESYNPEEDDAEEEIESYPKNDAERKRILEHARDIFLFRVLDETELNAVIDAMKPVPVKDGDTIIRQGEDGDFFYLIDNGVYDIFIKDQEGEDQYIASYENKGYFGELALLHNQPRSATIKATSDGFLWAVSRKTFNRLIVKRAFEKRQTYMKLLETVPELQPLTDYEKMQVADALKARVYVSGDTIVHEGDDGDGMYFIVEGKVSVRQKDTAGGEQEVTQLSNGAFFGELALVKRQPRAASVVALEETRTAFLDVAAFERLLGPCLEIMERYADERYK